MKIVFLDSESVGAVELDAIKQFGELICVDTLTAKQNLPELTQHADILISNKVLLQQDTLANCKNLKLICVAATGYNNIDLPAAQKQGIAVTNVAGYSTNSVAQHVFAMLLNWSIQLQAYQTASQNGQWLSSPLFCLLDYPIFELQGKTLALFGYGTIAQAVEKIALAFGMNVIIAERQYAPEPRAGRISYQDAIQQADVISLHCPLTRDSEQMVDDEFIRLMKKDAILVNTARGGLINETALANALQQGRIQAALLDGLSQEPPSLNNPLLVPQANLQITPHTAWASQQARQTLVNEIAKNIDAFMQGEHRNRIC
ncbi:hypothetical protein C2869_18860 [Saccharobesus litoralis]|uniref:Glycerate dehydrogenase n=1 Tax=Saccharobesus litoralis TaxID=2172099 RepID=A0A2S0VVZ2_9ALTE|nr:D-2-hydroxyacid dehydrogenase [Saccharobesus litoralis]AWB68342.1 hypothetical protein C2869_18860 [Saccharobesus litoralis]